MTAGGGVGIIEIDIQGVAKIQTNEFFDGIARYIFVKPRSFDDLKSRLQKRGSENAITVSYFWDRHAAGAAA